MNQTKRSRLDRNFRIALTLFLASSTIAGLTTVLRVQSELELERILTRLEDVSQENHALWYSINALQRENELLAEQVQTLTDEINQTLVPVCSTSTFKSWMSYAAITSPSSAQWKLQQRATTDANYGFRMVDGNILVAMGAEYGPVGTKYLIVFEDGKVINAMIGDIKHEGCTSTPDGSMLEFIVNKDKLPNDIKSSGNFNSLFSGSIAMIRTVE